MLRRLTEINGMIDHYSNVLELLIDNKHTWINAGRSEYVWWINNEIDYYQHAIERLERKYTDVIMSRELGR